MVSKLASQLQALAVAGGAPVSKRPNTRPSLLFLPSQAADIDLQTIFTLSQTGLEELIAMDGRFKGYKKTLFSLESSQLDRDLQSKEYNEKLNESITAYLHLLSGYVMLAPAHQTLEYLIRRHKIQVYNVEDVVLCVLPYHETSLFVRVVQLLQIKNSRWQFLETVQDTGAAPPREVLVQRCTYDMAVLEAICDLAVALSGIAAKSKTIISFTSVVVVETLAQVPIVSTELVNRILPMILHSFDNGIAEDYRVGALMIIGALSNRTTLASSLVETFSNLISRAFQKGSQSDGISVLQLHVMVIIQLLQTQKVDVFPSKAFKTLVKVRDFIPILTDLVKIFNTSKFLTLLVQALVEHCVQNEYYENALLDVLKALPVENQVVPSVLRLLEMTFGEKNKEASELEATEERGVVKTLLQAIENLYPAELDKATSIYFQRLKEAHRGRKEEDPVFIFLTEVFHGSLRSPLAETHMSLYLSLDHPQAVNREAAVKQLSKLASTVDPSKGAEIYTVLREAYLRRLSDDDYHVIRAVLTVKDLVKILPTERLFQALASIILRCRAELVAGERSIKGDAKTISKLAIDLLASEFLVQNPSYLNEVAFIFFDQLLQHHKTWRLNELVLKSAGRIPFHLFTDLAKVEAALGADEEGTKSKEKRRLWQATINGKIIQSLALKLADDSTALGLLLLRSPPSDNTKLLVALVLLQYFKQQPEGTNSKLFFVTLQWLRDEWTNERSGKAFPLTELQMIDYTKWDDLNCTPPEFYHQLEGNPTAAYLELLLRLLYILVICVPHNSIMNLKYDGGGDPLDVLFVLFAGSSSMKIFSPHVELLLTRLPAPEKLCFLSKFFIMEGSAVPAVVQVHSLDVLGSQLLKIAEMTSNTVDDITFTNLQLTLPPLLVALSSPLKAVRQSASNCVEHLFNAWEKHTVGGGKGAKQCKAPLLSATCFRKILESLVNVKATLNSSGTYLWDFFKEKYGPSKNSPEDQAAEIRDEDYQSIVTFFVNKAFCLTVYGQHVLLGVLQGIAHGDELVRSTHERLTQLVERRRLCHLQNSSLRIDERLTEAEVQLFEVLLQMYTPEVANLCSQAPDGDGNQLLSSFFKSLEIEGGSLADPAVLKPCSAVLKCLTADFYSVLRAQEQDTVFRALVSLSAINNETIRSLAHEPLRKIKISSSVVSRHLEHLLAEGLKATSSERRKKRIKSSDLEKIGIHDRWPSSDKLLSCTTTILDLLVWKSDLEERQRLVMPLFKLLRNIVTGAWPCLESDEEVDSNEGDLPRAVTVRNIQHLILMTLEGIVNTLTTGLVENKELINQAEFDVDVVVMSVNKAADGTTRNHALALLTSLGRLIPDVVLKHLVDIVAVVGESTLTQDDSHSHQVVHHMLTAVVPGWLAIEKDPTALLQVFISALPRVPVHRRVSVITNLLSVTTADVGLHIFLFLLLQKATTVLGEVKSSTEDKTANGGSNQDQLNQHNTFEVDFAVLLCRQYSPDVRLPAMVKLLSISKASNKIHSIASPGKSSTEAMWALQQLANQFVADQLQSPDLHVGAQLTESSSTLQKSYVALMEQILLQLQTLGRSDSLPQKLKRGAQEGAVSLLDGLTLVMASTEYIKGISSLMKHSDTNIRRKVLRMYTSKMRELEQSRQIGQGKKKRLDVISSEGEMLTAEERDLQIGMVKDITSLLAGPREEASISTKHAAIEALTVSSRRFAQKLPEVFTSSLVALIKHFQLKNRTLTIAAMQCVATILAKVGPHSLPALPETVSAVFEITDQALAAAPGVGTDGESHEGMELAEQSKLIVSILDAVEAMLDKLGAFLTPYLQNIVNLVLLRPRLIIGSDVEIITRAAAVRALLPGRIPARLLLEPLLSTYERAIETGEDSTCALFDMLAAMTTKADRSSVAVYHGRIFEFCLAAFDLRRRSLSTLQAISRVETAVVTAVVSLVMKLSETTFKPLFVKTLEWAESDVEVKEGSLARQSVDRNIVFYKLVNQLAAKLRSVFVPYLQYLINGCVHHLMGGLSEIESIKPKKKKKKKQNSNGEQQGTLSSAHWHLRQLVLSALQKCFLYDNINFLDAPKFQLLLEPVVNQLVVEAPPEVRGIKEQGESAEVPSLQEMDDTLVSCLGQMALTAGTDLLWKPLNREVLMRTRVENVRTRLLGLRVVKFLAEHLKEEYLVLLPETIPFLAELLEDTELAIVAKTQEVVKLLEDSSGEDLAQYF